MGIKGKKKWLDKKGAQKDPSPPLSLERIVFIYYIAVTFNET